MAPSNLYHLRIELPGNAIQIIHPTAAFEGHKKGRWASEWEDLAHSITGGSYLKYTVE